MLVKYEIIDKRIKDGFFFTKYIVTVKPIEKLKPIPIEVKFSLASYHYCHIGDIITLTFNEEDDGLYYIDQDAGFSRN